MTRFSSQSEISLHMSKYENLMFCPQKARLVNLAILNSRLYYNEICTPHGIKLPQKGKKNKPI